MRVAWITHHVPRNDGELGLPNFVGGAEMTDAAMIAAAPSEISVEIFAPHMWETALNSDAIVITGTDLLSPRTMYALAEYQPLVWVHHQQTPSRARQRLFEMARPFVTMSKAHAEVEAAWSGVFGEWNHGVMDLPQPSVGSGALWAARNHPQKGLKQAQEWAEKNGQSLTVLTDVSRQTVLDAMRSHHYFVFFPQAFDSCPRTLIEAEAAGCQIVTNDLAGRRDLGDIYTVIAYQAEKFWSWI